MSTPYPTHPRVPRGSSAAGRYELLVIQRASLLIDDLGSDLDRQLTAEARPTERLRLLRETTNRITRTANDAIQAYAKARRAIDAQLERSDANAEIILSTRARLQAARLDLLRALGTAQHRYPWAEAAAEEAAASADAIPDGAVTGR